jgi:hypothetical protein
MAAPGGRGRGVVGRLDAGLLAALGLVIEHGTFSSSGCPGRG